jgi:hypothetical protein
MMWEVEKQFAQRLTRLFMSFAYVLPPSQV